MAEFQYTAKSLGGSKVTGQLSAFDRQDALKTLVAQSLAPMQLKELRSRAASTRSVSGLALVGLYTRLADLLHAGVPLLRALQLLTKKQKSAQLSEVLSDVHARVSEGAPLADAFHANASVFGELPINIVRAGEEGGFLEDALRRVAVFTEQTENLKRKIVGALAYPAFLLCTGTLVLLGMMIFFVPKFAPIFERLQHQGELPTTTSILLLGSDVCRQHAIWLILAVFLIALLVNRVYMSEFGRKAIERLRLKLVVIGPLTQQIAVSRFCRVFGILLRNDVPMLRSLRIAQDSTGSLLMREAIRNAATHVTEGKRLSVPLEESGQFPDELIEIISVGEDANNLDEVLLAASESMDRRVEQQLELLVRLLEPALLLVMAVVILFFLTALLMPVFQTAHLLN